ncbi:hypothetical protein FB567DRAFT_602803 [Paraphoma chrysanthemicola]|uniref:DUF6594 domain-containing protein n=1 Tax=Paraphoma chrysanthemicola TaxID=798071 RepID=A0A8K0VZ82_9PLEO|nr:hypothetical protein FB567DRAFT_602803 [Paraphoma chrysanthemicola]
MGQVFTAPVLPVHNPAVTPGVHNSTHIPMNSLSAPVHTNGPTSGDPKKQPWKVEGYQEFSKWMASADDFFVFRRFESLNAATILWMQHRISELERRLQEIHQEVVNSEDNKRLKNSSFAWDAQWMQERTKIMGELSCLLLQYNQSIDAFSKIRARPRAEDRQIKNVATWLKRKAINPKEAAFIQQEGDLIAINSRSRPPLGQWVEACQSLHLWKLFRAKFVPGLHVDSKATVYSSDSKFEGFTTVSIIATGLIMLLAPMWWLECISESENRLKIITGFICVFITIMSMATINRPFEVVAATAAYAAVLMVFMQIDGKNKRE